ncbi:MAG: hypothetical protein ACXVCY_09745 [Pseudobdellovibrionaceae bacterium]
MNTPVVFLLSLFVVSTSFGSTSCRELRQELQSMQRAQQQIMISLVNNHETFASTLEEYSLVSKEGVASKTVSVHMNESARAFRARGVHGKEMADKLNKATSALFARVLLCLKH